MLQCYLVWNRSNTKQALGVTGQDTAWPAPPQYLLIQLVKPLRAKPQILNALSQAVQTHHVPWPTHLATLKVKMSQWLSCFTKSTEEALKSS